MSCTFTESVVEQAALAWLERPGEARGRAREGRLLQRHTFHGRRSRGMSTPAEEPGGEVALYESPDGEVR
jgi:hypothetical protein